MARKLKLEVTPREYGLIISSLQAQARIEKEKAGRSVNIENRIKHEDTVKELEQLTTLLVIQVNL